MATGESLVYDLPYPNATDAVNVHGDIKQLVDKLEIVLPPLGLGYFQTEVRNESGSSISAGTPVYITGHTTKTTVDKCLPSTTQPILGLMKYDTADASDGIVVVAGVLDGVNTSSFADGDILYVGEFGGLSNTQYGGAVGIVFHAAAQGVVVVEAKGNGTWGSLKSGMA